MTSNAIRIAQAGMQQTVYLDDRDISGALRGITVRMEAGETPQVELGLRVFQMLATAGKTEVHIADATRELLTRFGWILPTAGTGNARIVAERLRQIGQGWTAEHDDHHHLGQLLDAALFYLDESVSAAEWPWDELPSSRGDDRVADLTKAGALIAAEIDRLLRARGQA